MPFQLSPGVNVSEIDLTTVVPAVAATGGCIAGEFAWGPIMERKLLGDEDSVANMFGKPTNTTAISFFTAANFLAYGNSLQIVRVAQTGQANATTDGSTGSDALLIENDDDWENNWEGGQNVVSGRYFAAKYAGALGNTLKVSVCPSAAAFRSTVNVSTTGATLTLTSGNPEDHLAVGSLVIYGGETRQVEAITAGTSATLDSGFSSDISAADATFEWECTLQSLTKTVSFQVLKAK